MAQSVVGAELRVLDYRQILALQAVGIESERIYVDEKFGSTTGWPGLHAVMEYARTEGVIMVRSLDRLGRTADCGA